MGAGHVGSPVLVDTWRPGAFDDVRFRSQIDDQLKKSDGSIEKQSANRQSAIDQQSEICNLKSALRRFRFPIPTRVVVQEGRPVRVQTDRQGFTSGAIVQAAGPWRTSGNWWDTSASAREQSSELRRDRAVAASGREGGPAALRARSQHRGVGSRRMGRGDDRRHRVSAGRRTRCRAVVPRGRYRLRASVSSVLLRVLDVYRASYLVGLQLSARGLAARNADRSRCHARLSGSGVDRSRRRVGSAAIS